MSVNVMVTRAEPGASETCARLARAGYHAMRVPMLRIVENAGTRLDLDQVSDLVFTSANGVRAFTARSDVRGLTAWCVGPATLSAADAAGFTLLRHGDGNADDLVRLILRSSDAGSGVFLHVANDAAAGQVVDQLVAHGFTARLAPIYRTEPAAGLPEVAQVLLQSGQRFCLLIHSAKAAEAFRKAIGTGSLAQAVIVAVSDKAAAPLAGLGARAVVHAARPNEDALLDALDTACLGLKLS